ncbi:hypothetical protein HMPREF9446_01590 [Bacteroides fluxus YIT 12057]|uniref:Uncharacterized protein n=1 Tax=Bacteroides fluxus YIT 12057 TaxID=763034 RepID=F3PS57_9BACE|nr:hypothetical protein HMPREF9446_01590 [Bacteroides fluxus YIT 12057]
MFYNIKNIRIISIIGVNSPVFAIQILQNGYRNSTFSLFEIRIQI